MKYMFVNVSGGNLQVDLHSPNVSYQRIKMHRLGPDVVFNIPRGAAIDILPYFNGSLEKAHVAVKHSRDVMQLLRPNLVSICVTDDAGNLVDVDKLLSVAGSEAPVTLPQTVSVPPSRALNEKDLNLETAVAAKKQLDSAQRDNISMVKTYVKVTKDELVAMSKKDLLKFALQKFDLKIDKSATREVIIDTILGVQ